jgi:chaperonin GroEL
MPKTILYNEDARAKLKSGIDQVANAVKVTLGAKGRNVIIDNYHIPTIISKDGVTIAKNISLKDPVENVGASLVIDVAIKALQVCGDGTTTTVVLMQAIFNEGMKLVAAGVNPMELKKGIDVAVQEVVAQLKEQAIPVTDEMLKHVATVSANNDAEIGALVAGIYQKVGKDGVIKIEDSHSEKTEIKQVEGMEFSKGYLSQAYINNWNKMQVELQNPYILIYDRSITTMKELGHDILDKVLVSYINGKPEQSGRQLLIICADMEGEAYASLNVNRVKGNIPVAAVQAPSYGEARKELLQDIAIMTGGVVISEQDGYALDKLTLAQMGKCDSVIITKDSCMIVGGKGTPEAIQKRINELKLFSDEAGTKEIDKYRLNERAAKLAGGVAVMYVGGQSEIEAKEKKDRCDDAVRATKAAMEEGIVPGGGIALLRCEMVNKAFMGDSDFVAGYDLIARVLSAPLRQMCHNAGVDGGYIVRTCVETNKGYNLVTEKFEDLIQSGIIDPVKVVRVAIEQAASVAGLALTSDVLMVEIPEEQKR